MDIPNDPDAILTMKEVSRIGMRALTLARVREFELDPSAWPHKPTLRYSTGVGGMKAQITTSDLIWVMRPYARTPPGAKKIGRGPRRRGSAVPSASGPKKANTLVRQFIGRYFAKIRMIICKNKTSSKSLGTTTTNALIALSAWIVARFHVSSPYATACASSILIVATKTAKETFCEMTESQAAKIFPKPKPSTQTKKKKS